VKGDRSPTEGSPLPRYISKYAIKAESSAPAFPAMLEEIASSVDCNASMQSVCTKLLNKMIGERVYSAQETAHLLLGLPIVKSTFSYATLNLAKDGNLREVQTEGDTEDEHSDVVSTDTQAVTGASWMQRYVGRDMEEMNTLSMQQMLQRYTWLGGRWKKKDERTTTIVRVFPRISPNPEGDAYEDYCRIKYLLHHPYRHLSHQDFLTIAVNGKSFRRTWTDLYLECSREHHHEQDTLREWREES
jgi:ATP-dependent DNA helicase PIF1